jgi:hypothetical protein
MTTGTELLEHGISGQTLAAQLASVIMQTGFKDRDRETAIGKVCIQAKACWERGDFGDKTWDQCCREDLGLNYETARTYMREVREPGYVDRRNFAAHRKTRRATLGSVATLRGGLLAIERIWNAFPEGHEQIVDLILTLSRPTEVRHAA